MEISTSTYGRSYFLKGFVYVILYQALVEFNRYLIVLESNSSYSVNLFYLPPGLSLAFLILMGPQFFPFLLINPIINTILHDRPWYIIVFLPLIITAVYGSAAYILKKILHFDTKSYSVKNLAKFTGIATLAPLITGILFNLLLLITATIPPDMYITGVRDWFIGDLIGIFTLFPLVLAIYRYLSTVKFNFQLLQLHQLNINIGKLIIFIFVNVIVYLIFYFFAATRLNLVFLLLIPSMLIATSSDPIYTMFIGAYTSLLFSFLLSVNMIAVRISEIQAFMFTIVLATMFIAAIMYDKEQVQKRLEEEREQRFQDTKYTMLGKLASGISHDFKNVLTSISNYFSLIELNEFTTTPDDIQDIRHVLQTGTNLAKQLQSLGMFQTMQKSDVDLNTIITNLRATLENLVDQQITINYDLAREPCYVFGNTGHFEQIILNLVINAYESMDGKEGEINIATARIHSKPEQVRLRIRDTGKGISKEVRANLFDMLYTTKTKNSGLGLWIVSEITSSLEGSIEFESELEIGTEFTIIFPCFTK